MCSHLFIFSNGYQPFLFFSSSSLSSSPSHLHILHNSSLFSLYKNLSSFFSSLPDSLILSNSLIFPFLPFFSSSSQMAPKAKKSSYILSADAFHFTRWNGATRLVGPLPLTYWPENHIPIGESISFSFFFLFSSSSLIFGLNVFYLSKCLGFVVDGFRWKPDALGRVGTCLGCIFDNAFLKMLKNCFCLCSCVRGLRPVYIAYIHAYAALFLLTHVCSWGFVYVGMNLCPRGLVCVRVPWRMYVRRLAEALLYPFSIIFHLFHFPM